NDIPQRELENWERLKLISISIGGPTLAEEGSYDYGEDILKSYNSEIEKSKKLELDKGYLSFTKFGKNFAKAVGIIK
ncbi:Abi-alpha family protein, partial [Rodentibacter caecimuris]|uniref:Abi-alpha family protein n=1 Tax=Rodentibacter caecimuris TaxID=1796644 RepID=UPI00101AE03F